MYSVLHRSNAVSCSASSMLMVCFLIVHLQYEIPSGDDRFDLEVSPPYGTENVTVYASTSPTGTLDVKPAGGVFSVANKLSEISATTRGVKFAQKDSGKSVAEFAEATASAITRSTAIATGK